MALYSNELDILIDKLENSIPWVDTGWTLGFKIDRHDWRPIWALCKEIGDKFKGFKGYATREDHQAAWERFQTLRKRASELCDIEKSQITAQSHQLKTDILHDTKVAYWSMSADAFLGPLLGSTTIEELQQLQSILKRAGKKLSENKHYMTKADKEECFQAIKESRESHDRFYQKIREFKDERLAASQRKQEEFVKKREAWRERTQVNIKKNENKLTRARGALERTRERISEIEYKLIETNSDKWQAIFSEWLSGEQSKETDIEESISRIEGWINEDQSKLNDSYD